MSASATRLSIERGLRRVGLHPRRRVFGIGLPRTGTVSLTGALNRLGFRVLHYPHDARTFDELKRGIGRLSVLDDYDGITDIPTIPIYRELARVFPRSRFILTMRDEAEWLSSVREHWRRYPSHAEDETGDPDYAFRRWTRQAALGVTEFDAAALGARRMEHLREVEDYFRAEPERLLVLNLCGGEGWERLCPFLGKAVPRKDFPWQHQAPGPGNANAVPSDL